MKYFFKKARFLDISISYILLTLSFIGVDKKPVDIVISVASLNFTYISSFSDL